MSKREMQQLKGGTNSCGCACQYEGTLGGSTTFDNGYANSVIPTNSKGDKSEWKIIVKTEVLEPAVQ